MESLANTLQFNELTSVSPTENFKKDVTAQNDKKFNVVSSSIILVTKPENGRNEKVN